MITTYLKKLRMQRDIRQVDISTSTGISQPRYSCLENGLAPKADEAKRFASFFNVEVSYIFDLRQNPHLLAIYEAGESNGVADRG